MFVMCETTKYYNPRVPHFPSLEMLQDMNLTLMLGRIPTYNPNDIQIQAQITIIKFQIFAHFDRNIELFLIPVPLLVHQCLHATASNHVDMIAYFGLTPTCVHMIFPMLILVVGFSLAGTFVPARPVGRGFTAISCSLTTARLTLARTVAIARSHSLISSAAAQKAFQVNYRSFSKEIF